MKYFIRALFILLSMGIIIPGAMAEQSREEQLSTACKEGNGAACFEIGERYRTLEKDTKKAVEYYVKACDDDFLLGCTNGGMVLAMKGTPYSKNFKQARKMFDKACEGGQDQSCYNLGTLNYKEGRQSKAIKYYKRACGMGNQAGCAKEKRLKR